MRSILFVDPEKCTGCEICVLYCSFEKTETFNPTRSRVNIIRWEERDFVYRRCASIVKNHFVCLLAR